MGKKGLAVQAVLRWGRPGFWRTCFLRRYTLPHSLCSPAGVCAEFLLVESGGHLRVPGESVHLSCRGSDFNFAIYSVLWYRQALGGSLQWLSYINPDSSYIRYGSAVKGRATASRDNSKSKTALTLNNLHLQDSARYFCAVHTGTGNLAEL